MRGKPRKDYTPHERFAILRPFHLIGPGGLSSDLWERLTNCRAPNCLRLAEGCSSEKRTE